MIVLKVLGKVAAVVAALWISVVLYSGAREILRSYRASVVDQNLHYRGWRP